MILRPEELGFLRYLKQANVPLNEFEFSWNKVANIQVTNLHNLREIPPPPPFKGFKGTVFNVI